MKTKALFVSLILVALVIRMGLVVPVGIFPTVVYQRSLYMPVAVLLSSVLITWGVVKGLIVGSRLLLAMIILSGPVLLAYSTTTKDLLFILLSVSVTLVSVVCFFFLVKRRNAYSLQDRFSARDAAIGVLIGAVVCLIFDIVVVLFGGSFSFDRWFEKSLNGILVFLAMLFLAPVFEEPLFRGALAWVPNEKRVQLSLLFFAQLAFFWVGHLYYLGNRNWDFFLLVPLCGVLFGLVTLRTKSLTPAFFAHAVVNAFYVQFVVIKL